MVRIGICPECAKEVAAVGPLAAEIATAFRCPHCAASVPPDSLSLREIAELNPAEDVSTAAAADEPAASENGPDVDVNVGDGTPAQSPIDMPVITASLARGDGSEGGRELRGTKGTGATSFARHLLGVVGGGVVGLTMGYFILLWIGGPEKDFLRIGDHLPRWAVPAAFQRRVAEPPADRVAAQSLTDLWADLLKEPDTEQEFDRAGMPPEPLDAATADPAPTYTQQVGIVDAPPWTTSELLTALGAASEVRLALVAGEISDPAARPQKSAAYQTFAALAEAVTFAEPGLGRGVDHDRYDREAERLFREALTTERMARQLGPLAAEWIDFPQREHDGVVVAGLVIGAHMGMRHRPGLAVELIGDGRMLYVVGPGPIEFPTRSRVLVVGSLVDQPRQRIEGYTGSAPQVIWSRLVFAL